MSGPMTAVPISPKTERPCPHCRHASQTGTRGGCALCGKVKHTADGRVNRQKAEQEAD